MTINKKHKGFTLIEMVIALGIFMIFLGGILSVFVDLTNTQQRANLSRESISEAKDILNYISIEAREKKFDYMCSNTDSDIRTNDPLLFDLQCGTHSNVDDIVLSLISNDGLHRLLIEKSEASQDPLTYKIKALSESRDNILTSWKLTESIDLHSDQLQVRNFTVHSFPNQDPYDLSSDFNPEDLQHPVIQIILEVYRNAKNPNAEITPIILQTSITSRSYNPQTL